MIQLKEFQELVLEQLGLLFANTQNEIHRRKRGGRIS